MSTIILGISGSIAAYKAVYLARALVEAGHAVWPILTQSATRFVGPMSLSVLTGHRAIVDLWSSAEAGEVGHVELAHRADLLVIAPCTADLLARLAAGRADDPLCAVALATRAPRLIAPAMESGMWSNPLTQQHVERLRGLGVTFVEPESGFLASGRSGEGRLAEPDTIVEVCACLLATQDLAGRHVVVTAGPTREAFDPVRFLSNRSSGKMGYAIARVARRRGARVTLISGPSELAAPHSVEMRCVETTQEMLEACCAVADHTDVLVMAAAPVDFRPRTFSKRKLKKGAEPSLTVDLERTPDILAEVRPLLRANGRAVQVVGFAAETHNIITHAREKLAAKDLDFIVANDVTQPDAGFAVDTNAGVLLGRDGRQVSFEVMTKERLADLILDRIANPAIK